MATGSNQKKARHSREGQLEAQQEKKIRAQAGLKHLAQLNFDDDVAQEAPVEASAVEADALVSAEPVVEPAAQPETFSESELEPEVDTTEQITVAAEETAEAEPEAAPEVESNVVPEAAFAEEPVEAMPEQEPLAELSEEAAEPEVGAEPEPEAELEPAEEPELEVEPEAGAEAAAEPEADESGVETEPELESEPAAEPEAELEPETELEPQAEPEDTLFDSEAEVEPLPVDEATSEETAPELTEEAAEEPAEEQAPAEGVKEVAKKIAKKISVPGKATGKRPSLFKRLFLALVIITAVTSLLVLVLASNIYQSTAVDEMAVMLESECTLVKSTLRGDSSDLMRLANLNLGEIHLTYLSAEGEPLYDNQANIESLSNMLDKPEVAEAINEGAGSSEALDEASGSTYIYRALRLDNGCVVRLGAEKAGTAAAVARQNFFAIVLAFGIVLASWIIARLVSAMLINPIFKIDPENPEDTPVYAELEPLVNQVTIQRDLLGSPELVDIHALASNVARKLRPRAKDKNIRLVCSGNAVEIYGMPNMLQTLMSNLVDNAICYNEEGGRVRIWTGEEDGFATLRVEDTGIGIPEEELSRVFERFYRTEQSAEYNEQGNGMGLSYVQQAAEAHGAEITLESEEGSGTTITLRFPLP